MSPLDEMADALSFILDEQFDTLTLGLATFDQGTELPVYRSLNISDEIATDFTSLARDRATVFARMHRKGDLLVRAYAPGYKLDRHEVEFLSTNDQSVGDLLNHVPTAAQLPLFGDIDDFVDRVRFYIIVLSAPDRRVVLFRRYNRNKELQRSRNIVMRLIGERYERLVEPTFQFDQSIDAILYRDRLFVLNKSNVSHIFRYHDQLRDTAAKTLDIIQKAIPIDGFSEFQESCLAHQQKLEKLRNIAQKPYLANVTMAKVKRVIASFDLGIEVRVVNGDERLVFDRKDRWAILNLLDDAYLESDMTGLKYETNSKREV